MHITHFAFLLQQARFASVLISCFQNACLFYCFRAFYLDSNLILFRLGSPCVHVVSVLFRIETAHRLGVSACTSLPCSWTVPAFKSTRAPPSKLKELEVSKPVHSLTCGKKRSLVSTIKKEFNPVHNTTKDCLKDITDAIRNIRYQMHVFLKV